MHPASVAPGLIIQKHLSAHTNIIVCHSDQVAATLSRQIHFFGKEVAKTLYLPDTEILPYDEDSPSADVVSRRALVLNALCNADTEINLVVSAPTLIRKIAASEFWAEASVFKKGDIFDVRSMPEKMVHRGYKNQEIELTEPGDFIVKNQVVDIFLSGGVPARLRLDEQMCITSIEEIDLNTQLSSGSLPSVRILPAAEYPRGPESLRRFKGKYLSTFERGYLDGLYKAIINGESPIGVEFLLPFFTESNSLLDVLGDRLNGASLIFMPGAMERVTDSYRHVQNRYRDVGSDPDRRLISPEHLWISPHEVIAMARQHGTLIDLPYQDDIVSPHGIERQLTLQLTVDSLVDHLHNAEKVLFCLNSESRIDQLEVVCDLLGVDPLPVSSWDEFMASSARHQVAIGPIVEGFWYNGTSLVVTEKDILGETIFVQSEGYQEKGRTFEQIQDLQNLEQGDPVVHVEYGVGRLIGLEKMMLNNRLQEFLTIEYAESAKAYVNMDDLHLVSRYGGIAMEDTPLDVMGAPRWRENLEIAIREIRETAKSLLKLEVNRSQRKGIQMRKPGGAYHRFVNDFPFQETRDQRKAIQEVIEDLMSEKPMDRTVVGDVGFGKTEVALRAAFVAAESGHQVAVMVPTTLLAQQHYESFAKRLEKYGKRVALLSRFDRDFERKTLYELKTGKIDIVIGTHRVIQKDVEFESLGLLIVDEEHRFGVQHKTKLAEIRESLNVLCLTATPIPRTLGMSLQGVRDLSIISTAPSKRLSIRTFVKESNERVIAEAIEREMMRDGQVFYLHNRTEELDDRLEMLKKLAPSARIRYAHGQMNEDELTSIMRDFYEHKFDILLCTTIIEIGIDIPNANTILIERANNFGLAQLHQLRGRVGRSHHQGYAYLLIDDVENVSESGKKRLYAMQKASRLGDGFLIATHDLEIRGAGELLGEEQSGHIRNIGFALYMRLLNNALVMLKRGMKPSEITDFEATLDVEIGLSGIIDDSYIASERMRVSIYKRFAELQRPEDAVVIQDEMRNRFGSLPRNFQALLTLTSLRCYLRAYGIRKVVANDSNLTMEVRENPMLSMEKMIDMINDYGEAITLLSPTRFSLDVPMPSIKDRMAVIQDVVDEIKA